MANTDPQSTPVEKTLMEKVNEALASVDDKGKLVFLEDVDPVFKELVRTTQQSKAHQASFTKSRQEIADLKAKKDLLETKVKENLYSLTVDQQDELEDLKFKDPDAWYNLKVKYETEARQTLEGTLKEQLQEVSKKAISELTLEERTNTLRAFQDRTGIVLTDDIMTNDIPPRLQNKMSDMPFEDYLQEVASYLNKGKVVKQTDESLNITNIGNLPGTGDVKPSGPSKYQIL